MGDDLDGSGWELLFLLLAGELHHLLHEPYSILCCHRAHCLDEEMVLKCLLWVTNLTVLFYKPCLPVTGAGPAALGHLSSG